MEFSCPICGLPLNDGGIKQRICPRGHSFDRAKEGYINLLVGGKGGTHGDNREMVEARRKFLSLGHYRPLAERVRDHALSATPKGGVVLDLGAGEGYYTSTVADAIWGRDGCANIMAIDISKDAVKVLSKKIPIARCAVASCYKLPIETSSVDCLVLLFSPLAVTEIRRVMKPRAKFIMAFPDERHLWGLKEAIYDEPYLNKPLSTEIEGFRIISDELLEYKITLSGKAEIESLFKMTPYAYRTGAKERERLESLDSLTTDIAFRIVVYEKLP